MITLADYEIIKNSLDKFKYHSLAYTDYEEIKEYKILHNDDRVILIHGYSLEDQFYKYHWACNEVDILVNLEKIKDTKGLIGFVPKEWVENLKEIGFKMYAVWNEYFVGSIKEQLERLEDGFKEDLLIEVMQEDECESVSQVTLACKGQSRGFSGQSAGWIANWMEGKEPALPEYARNSKIFVKKIEDRIVGMICVATYGHESEKGAILWIREVAVHPMYQGRGIARVLIKKAYNYGIMVGAKRAFLMADECNEGAIHLYQSMGFVSNEAEINMIKE